MDKVCPTFGHFSVYEQKLTKLSQNLTVFPSHFKNIFLKSFVLLQNLRRNCKILQKLMRFHKTNKISQSFSGTLLLLSCDILCWLSVLLLVLSKDDWKNLISFKQIQIFEVSNLAMVKVKKSQYRSYLLSLLRP